MAVEDTRNKEGDRMR